jgi:hypothetical protein
MITNLYFIISFLKNISNFNIYMLNKNVSYITIFTQIKFSHHLMFSENLLQIKINIKISCV